jgi:hypothetical protein
MVAVKALSKPFPLPAPSKGIDAITNLMQMQPDEALYIYNMRPTQNGLQVRDGYQDWCTGMAGAGGVRTVIAVRGANTAGNQDYLFACTIDGIYDCTSSSAAPTLVVTFPTQTGNAGWGQWEHCTNAGGDVMLMYCDEVNGYYTFDTSTYTWLKITQGFQGTGTTTGTALTIQSTVAGTIGVGAELYTISGGVLTDTGFSIVSGAGTAWVISGSPALPTGTTIAIINQAKQVYGVNPANFAGVRLHENRVWFVQGGSGNAWYLPVGQVYGVATLFSFGNKFPHGGNLNNLYVFTYGSYFGIYLYLVGVGDTGDVIAYTGTDPNVAASWTMTGQWYIGDMPPGRRNATNYGGDLLLLCNLGIIALSSLFYQKDIADPNSFLTKKIAPAIGTAIQANQIRGWEILEWAAHNELLITQPGSGIGNIQFAYSFYTNGWSIFKYVPMQTASPWHGNLYAGTMDGRIILITGGQDAVVRTGGGGIAINWGALGAFNNVQLPGVQKFVDTVRAYILTDQQVSYSIFCRYDFDISDLALGSGLAPPETVVNGWDSGLWDSAIWGAGSQAPQISLGGIAGAGRYISVGILGASNGNTTLIGYEASVRPTTSFL